jgi:hypothetical protein
VGAGPLDLRLVSGLAAGFMGMLGECAPGALKVGTFGNVTRFSYILTYSEISAAVPGGKDWSR